MVTGCCQGLDISLDSEHLPFGAVVQHSRSSRRVLMINSGDIGARWVEQVGGVSIVCVCVCMCVCVCLQVV